MITEDKPICILDEKKYYVDIVEAAIDGKSYTIRNFIPVFKSGEDRERVKEQISNDLYKIFAKYTR